MRKLERPESPACFTTDTEEAANAHRARYAQLRYPSGGVRALWNDLDKDEHGVSAVRRALLAMSDGECAYCGQLVGNDHMQVDHYLPRELFPLVAYAWDNLLPSCGACNRHKLEYVPPSLKGKTVVEACLRDTHAHDFVFDKPQLLGELARDDRLVDPSFDDPIEHIELLMDTVAYRPKTAIGRTTYARLLRRREIVKQLISVRKAARVAVDLALSDAQLEHFAIVSSYPSWFRCFVAYWRRERDEGRLDLWDRDPSER